MGLVTGNQVAGLVKAVRERPQSSTTTVKVDQVLEDSRFEGGLLTIAGVGSFDVHSNDRSTVLLPGIVTLDVGDSFTLWDDDDFNGDDAGPFQLDGDNNENVPAPDVSQLADSRDNGVCDYSSANVFGAAYVCPVFDLVGAEDDFVPFVLNTAADTTGAVIALWGDFFNNKDTEADVNFWTVYLLGAYQHTIPTDSDPDRSLRHIFEFENKAVLGAADSSNGQGAAIFKEAVADKNRSLVPGSIFCNEGLVVAHEVGHLFAGEHRDGGIMSNTCDTVVPVLSPATIATIRVLSNP
jgi:hypothetical protein